VDPKELEERRRALEQAAKSRRRAAPQITLLNEPLRHHEADGWLAPESTGELRGDGEVGVQPDRLRATDPES